MVSLWKMAFLMLSVFNAERQPWIFAREGVRLEPTRPIRQEADFGPDSAYRLLCQAGKLPPEAGTAREWWSRLERFRKHRWPAKAPLPATGNEEGWTSADYALIRSTLTAIGPNLGFARKAVAAPDPQVPTVASADTPVLYVGEARDLARLMVVSAYCREGEGKIDEAFAELVVCIRYGNLLSRGGSFIGHMVDMAGTQRGAEALWRMSTRTQVPVPVLRRTARELLATADAVEPFVEAVRGEAKTGLQGIRELYGAKVKAAMGVRASERSIRTRIGLHLATGLTGSTRQAMERDFTYLYQHLVDLAGKPYHEEVRDELVELVPRLSFRDASRALRSKKDPLGLTLAQQLVPLILPSIRKAAERDAVLRGTALYLAVLSYEKDTGLPPKALAALVPEYLPRVPLDPFDGKPFRYRVGQIPAAWGDVRWGLYSIGGDFSDDGGKASDGARPHRDSPDIVWIPKPFPQQPPAKAKMPGMFGE